MTFECDLCGKEIDSEKEDYSAWVESDKETGNMDFGPHFCEKCSPIMHERIMIIIEKDRELRHSGLKDSVGIFIGFKGLGA